MLDKEIYISLLKYIIFLFETKLSASRSNVDSGDGIRVLWLQWTNSHGVLWRRRDGKATLFRAEHPDPCLDRLVLLLWAHYIEDGPHLLCTGSL